MTDESPDLRGRLDKILESVLDDELLREVVMMNLATTKKVWVDSDCKHCRKRQRFQVDVPDAKATASALELLANQAKGRPDVAQQEDQERIVFQRLVHLAEEEVSS